MKHQIGWIVEFDGKQHEVVVANECRTQLRPIDKIRRTVYKVLKDSDGEKITAPPREFEALGRDVNIAPTTPLKVIGRVEREIPKRETCCGFIMPVGFNYEPPKELQRLAVKTTTLRKVRRAR